MAKMVVPPFHSFVIRYRSWLKGQPRQGRVRIAQRFIHLVSTHLQPRQRLLTLAGSFNPDEDESNAWSVARATVEIKRAHRF
jgi:hypothetical protein